MTDHKDSSLVCSASECVSVPLLVSMCLCVTVPLSPLLCNCLGLGWQSRPDKRTQIVSGDRLRRSVCSPLYLSSSITCVWQRQSGMMDGCLALSLSTTHSVHSVSLTPTHFSPLGFSSSAYHLLPPSFCSLSLCSLSLFLCLSSSILAFLDIICMAKVVCACVCASV